MCRTAMLVNTFQRDLYVKGERLDLKRDEKKGKKEFSAVPGVNTVSFLFSCCNCDIRSYH